MTNLLRFTGAQVQAVADSHFFDRICKVLGEIDPGAPLYLNTRDGQRTLQDQTRLAQSYGLQAELDVGRFIISAWVLGLGFDMRFPALQEILSDLRRTPAEKADALEALTSSIMEMLEQGRAQ